jgi:hypothetical protein
VFFIFIYLLFCHAGDRTKDLAHSKQALLFSGTGDLTQDLYLAGQILYHLSHDPGPFAFEFFFQIVSFAFVWAGHIPQSFYLTSQVAAIIDMKLPNLAYF